MRFRSATTSRGRAASIEYNKKDNNLTLLADHKEQLDTVIQVLKEKMAKRGVAVNALESRASSRKLTTTRSARS